MKNLFTLLLLLFTLSEITFSQVSDSVVYTKKVGLFKQLVNTKEYVYPVLSHVSNIFLDIPIAPYPEKEQFVLKYGDDIFIRFDATGFIFQLTDLTDSLATFKRIDKTVNFNYCIRSFNFVSGDGIYNYGGYGFWKNNGMIRKYDARSKEWSIIKTNEEIPPQLFKINNPWFNFKTEELYIPYRADINASLKNIEYMFGQITPLSYKLNLKSNEWEVLGNTSKETLKLIGEATLYLSTYKGLLVLSFEQLYLFDFENNRILKSDDNVFAQTFMRISDNNSMYHLGKTLYSSSFQTGKMDSVKLDLDSFKFTGQPIYTKIVDYTWAWIGGLAFLILLLFSGIYVIIIRRKKIDRSKTIEPKNFKFEFSDIEKGLIQMLLDKSKSNHTATINEINYVLGVKDKNIGLQKKVRSEVFNAVNEKFKLISDWDEPLVQSIRSESDKRYFEYMIRKDMIKEAERILQE
jgi:hypothetical protein